MDGGTVKSELRSNLMLARFIRLGETLVLPETGYIDNASNIRHGTEGVNSVRYIISNCVGNQHAVVHYSLRP